MAIAGTETARQALEPWIEHLVSLDQIVERLRAIRLKAKMSL